MLLSIWMMSSSSPGLSRNTWSSCGQCSNDSGSMDWSLNPWNVIFSGKKSPSWGTKCPRRVWNRETMALEVLLRWHLRQINTEIWRFLGATRFFWRFIKNYAWIAKPLNNLLEGETSKWKTQPVDLPLEAKEAVNILKMKCVTVLVLAFADFEKPFLLKTDASSLGLRAVLSQKQDDGKFHPVAYASQELKGGEGKYHSSKLEFLALKWAITNQFKQYLRYKPFTVCTDNNPLTYVMTTPNLDAIGHRWVATLAGYNMTLNIWRVLTTRLRTSWARSLNGWTRKPSLYSSIMPGPVMFPSRGRWPTSNGRTQ